MRDSLDAKELPLAGVVVLDLSRVLAGPYCTKILAQLGAYVIKVELPGTGDDSRAFGPFQQGKSLYFAAVNHDKRSIALDLKKESDRGIFEGLLAISDVLVENFRPGTMERLGYGWDTLKVAHPELVYASTSGFGHSGPCSQEGCYDLVVQARGGMMSLTGWPDGPPTRVGVSIGDLAAGMFLATGVVAGLLKKSRGAGGSMVDVAMLDCQVALLEDALTAHLATGHVPGPQGHRHPQIAPFQLYKTSDGHVVITAGNDRLFALLARAINRVDLLDRPEFQSNDARHAHVDLLQEELERTLQTRPTAEWVRLLKKAAVPCGPVNTVADLAHDEQVAARKMIVPTHDSVMGTVHVSGNPIKFEGVSEPEIHRAAPELDADREEVLKLLAQPS